MVGIKSIQTRVTVVGIIADKLHPYTFFIERLLLEMRCRDVPHLPFIPTTLVRTLFTPTIPTYFNLP